MTNGNDAWGQPLVGSPESVRAWDDAWAQFFHFRGDPIATLAPAVEADDGFVLGPIFCAAYRTLGGVSIDDRDLFRELTLARERRGGTERERAHLDALELLVSGEFTAAAERWDLAARDTLDLAAIRLAHDVWLHAGDAEGRLRTSSRAVEQWMPSDPGYSFVLGQHAFGLEEAGRFGEAERVGWQALELDPDDLWALHALAHVYESTENQSAAIDLLRGRQDNWSTQESLAVHIWWHLGLRLIAAESFDEVFDIYDAIALDATTPFRLSDLTSLLWRLELVGVDVGDRWPVLADRWAARPERHTCGFLDLHAAFAFARVPDHPAAEQFFGSLGHAHDEDRSENADTFRAIVTPLVGAIRCFAAGDPSTALALLDPLGRLGTHRIGGSIAQRAIIDLTHRAISDQKRDLT